MISLRKSRPDLIFFAQKSTPDSEFNHLGQLLEHEGEGVHVPHDVDVMDESLDAHGVLVGSRGQASTKVRVMAACG